MSVFDVQEHIIPGQHIREYPHGTRYNQEDVLEIAVKKYTPKENVGKDLEGAVTIITANGIGFPKEVLEPLYEELLHASESNGFKIRAIWAADWSCQGLSGVLNEFKQGDDTSWFDHSRDILLMINHFRNEIKRPIVGLGHSGGVAQLLQLSHYHPRLLHTLVLFEPVIQAKQFDYGFVPSMPSTSRPDLWPDRKAAEMGITRSKFFKDFDPKVLDIYRKFGVRETPTAIYPDVATEGQGPAATLTSTKYQEAWYYLRPNFAPVSGDWEQERLLAPDQDPEKEGRRMFWRAELTQSFNNLPHVRPSVLWVYGKKSHINTAEFKDEKMELTGTGLGGNGGASRGRVEMAELDGGHMVCCENIKGSAAVAASWLGKELGRWRKEEEFYRNFDRKKSERDGLVASKEYMRNVRLPPDTMRPVKGKL